MLTLYCYSDYALEITKPFFLCFLIAGQKSHCPPQKRRKICWIILRVVGTLCLYLTFPIVEREKNYFNLNLGGGGGGGYCYSQLHVLFVRSCLTVLSSPYEKVSAWSSQHLHSHLDSFGHLSLIKWIKVRTVWLQLYVNHSNSTKENKTKLLKNNILKLKFYFTIKIWNGKALLLTFKDDFQDIEWISMSAALDLNRINWKEYHVLWMARAVRNDKRSIHFQNGTGEVHGPSSVPWRNSSNVHSPYFAEMVTQ